MKERMKTAILNKMFYNPGLSFEESERIVKKERGNILLFGHQTFHAKGGPVRVYTTKSS